MRFGPTFADELKAAGILHLPFSWVAETGVIHNRENLTPAQNATLDAVIAAHDPDATPDWGSLDEDEINRALSQPGSIVRALGILTLKEINKLRQLAGQPQYTLGQFKAALKQEIRNGS